MMPKRIWKMPQKSPASDMLMSTALMECCAAQTPLSSEAVMTVMGPVGPLIWEWVPPKREAKKPRKVAPTSPARAPMELAEGSSMPPKAWMPNAKASGSATMPAVMPPKMSPFRLSVLINAIYLFRL